MLLFTKWVGTAWQDISRRLRETVIRSFEKCRIALPLDGSRDSEINIEGLDDYEVGDSADIEDIEFYTDSSDNDSE